MKIAVNSQALHQYLGENGLSRDELARCIGVDPATAYRVDKGRTEPSPRFIAALILETGWRFEELFELV